MSYQSINRGTVPNDNTGDTLRDGAEKINLNFKEIYDSLGDGNNITFNVSTFTTETQTFENKTIYAANNNINISVEDLSNVNAPIPAVEGQILQYSGTLEAWTIVDTSVSGFVLTDLIPQNDDSFDLGTPNSKFKNLYLSGNTIAVGNSTITVNNNVFEFDSSIKLGNGVDNVIIDANVIPVHDSTYNLGSPTHKFHSLYLSNSTIYLGESAISSGPNGLSFIEKTTQLVHIVEKNVFTFNPNIDIDNPFANTETGNIPPDQQNIYSIKGLSDAASNSNFFDVVGLENSGFGFRTGISFDSRYFIFDLPMYTAKLNIYAFTDFNNPILSFDFLQPYDINSNPNYFVDAEGFHTYAPMAIPPEGFVLGANGEVYIISNRTPQDFETIFAPFQNAIAGIYSPAPGINVQIEIYFTDPVKSVPKPIKPVETPAAISSGSAPTSNTANGVAGDMIVDSGYLYVCHTDNMWVRLPVETSW